MEGNFDLSLYNEKFFEWHLKHAREYSIKTMDWYIDNFAPTSVVDFGCGIGSYLESANSRGLKIKGYDISQQASKYTPHHLLEFIEYTDCTKELSVSKYDCVISFETAEHIDPSGTDQFITNIVNAVGSTLLFTAAPPGQLGTGHINMHPKQYWIDLISNNLKYNKDKTEFISGKWMSLFAPLYICENLIVFDK